MRIAAALPASAAELERVEARFEIFGFAGLHILTNRTIVQERGDHYTIATDLETRGLASVFVDLTSHSEVHGKLARDAPLPEGVSSDGQVGDEYLAFRLRAQQHRDKEDGQAHHRGDENRTRQADLVGDRVIAHTV